jgi:hypothetical protein
MSPELGYYERGDFSVTSLPIPAAIECERVQGGQRITSADAWVEPSEPSTWTDYLIPQQGCHLCVRPAG